MASQAVIVISVYSLQFKHLGTYAFDYLVSFHAIVPVLVVTRSPDPAFRFAEKKTQAAFITVETLNSDPSQFPGHVITVIMLADTFAADRPERSEVAVA